MRKTSLGALIAFSALMTLMISNCGKSADNNAPVLISIDYKNNIGQVPVTAEFTATVEDNVNVTWDFGDGQSGTGKVVSHQFIKKGVYKVIATAERNGIKNTAGKVVTIAPYGTLRLNWIDYSVIDTLPQGVHWDAEPSGFPPDVYFKVFDGYSQEVAPSYYYIYNSYNNRYSFSPQPEFKTFDRDFVVEMFDKDTNGVDEKMDIFAFRPLDYLDSFPTTIVNSGSSAEVRLKVSWVK
jgi:hypothetical protein